jgi:putative lipoic acid-binding regulatory protein
MADKDQDLAQNVPPPLIDFPCDFPIKVMGLTEDTFAQTIISLIQTIVPEFNASHVEMRASSAGKYISLTCSVHVVSQLQLDDIYRLISAHPLVKYAL